MITQQLLSRAKTLTMILKDGCLFSVAERLWSTCPSMFMQMWKRLEYEWREYWKEGSVSDGRKSLYLTEGGSDHYELSLTGIMIAIL